MKNNKNIGNVSMRRKYRNNKKFKRRINNRNRLPFSMSSRPTRYGPGQNVSIINQMNILEAERTYRIPLQSLLLGNDEFNAKKSFYRYFKIIEVRVCFFPSGFESGRLNYINFSWNAINYSSNDLMKDDSTKIISTYRTRNKVFRWLPIRGVINVYSELTEVPINFLDVSQFISTDRVVSIPGWLFIINNSVNAQNINIEVKIVFRANDFGYAAKKLIPDDEMFTVKEEQIEKDKERKEEEKEEEDEEEENKEGKENNREDKERKRKEYEEEKRERKKDKKEEKKEGKRKEKDDSKEEENKEERNEEKVEKKEDKRRKNKKIIEDLQEDSN